MAHRIITLLERIGVEKDFAITGGIAKNTGVITRLEKEVGVPIMRTDKYDTQIAGALGAALFAKALLDKGKK
jgi:activator of 2-hydroxyglutaryl-CoA dehydratase